MSLRVFATLSLTKTWSKLTSHEIYTPTFSQERIPGFPKHIYFHFTRKIWSPGINMRETQEHVQEAIAVATLAL